MAAAFSLLSYYASLLLTSSSVLAYASAPDQRFYRGFLAVWASYSSDPIIVGQPLAGHAFDEAFQPLRRMTRHIALVEPESELVNVPAPVLRADVVEGAINAALQDSPNGLDAVGRNAIADIFG
jgi:hypothetical protein